MIVGSSLTIEIGDRTLLRDASFVVGAGEKVGLVGRNGTGKSTFISVVIQEPGRNVRSTGSAAIRGTYGYLPQVPEPHGLGLEPNGFSHVLSGRGLDVLDDALGKARTQMAKDPSTENIALFSDLEEQFRENGGYEAESTMARLADGLGPPPGAPARGHREPLGWPAPPGRPHPDPVPGPGHHDPRRAHQPPRPPGQEVAHGRAGELPRGDPRGLPRPEAARPLDQQGPPPVRRPADRVQGHLLVLPGAAGGGPVPARTLVPTRGPGDRPPGQAGRLDARQHQPAGPHRQVPRQAGRAPGDRAGPRSTSGRGRARSSSRRPPAPARSRCG